jgi:glycosyltransferase involved in cell wall biosynthesis
MLKMSETRASEAAAVPNVPAGLLALVPAHNEAGRIGRVVEQLRSEFPATEVLVVNDGSSDDTGTEAREAGALVVELPINVGYGAALQTGYKYALRNGYDLIAQIDGDGQHDPVYLRKLLDVLAEDRDLDVVVGSRFLDRDGHYRPSSARRVGMALFGRIASLVTRQHISDPTSGFQVMRADVARFFCTNVYPTDYPDADILILLNRSGFRVREVGVRMRAPQGKSMHAGHRTPYYVYKMSLSILVTLLRRGSRPDS